MLPTQFTPEYYRDSKDITFVADDVERNQEETRPQWWGEMSTERIRYGLVLLVLLLLLATAAVASAEDGLTPEEVATTEREFTYTTAEDVAAGQLAAESYWLHAHTIHEIAAAEREFSYTTAEAVQKGKVAADAFWLGRETATSQ